MHRLPTFTCLLTLLASAAYATDTHQDLANALGYADSATFDCQIPEINDSLRKKALKGFLDTGNFNSTEAAVDAYMAEFRKGQSSYRMAIELGTPPKELCQHASKRLQEFR